MFPITNQSASVLDLLDWELERLGVEVRCQAEVRSIQKNGNTFRLDVTGESFQADAVILAAGGKSYPVSGTDGSAYALALSMGHTLVEPVPSTVPLLVEDAWCNHLTGQKITATVRYEIDGETGPPVTNDLLFTDYGLSGLAILDSSEELSIAIHRNKVKDAYVIVDLVPFMHEDELQKELSSRLRRKYPTEKLLAGILPQKFSYVLNNDLESRDPAKIIKCVKKKRFLVQGAKGWNEAEFTAGGIHLADVDAKTLESKKCPGLYLAGEILNVNGKRGGYNLAWAWASGAVAGQAASR